MCCKHRSLTMNSLGAEKHNPDKQGLIELCHNSSVKYSRREGPNTPRFSRVFHHFSKKRCAFCRFLAFRCGFYCNTMQVHCSSLTARSNSFHEEPLQNISTAAIYHSKFGFEVFPFCWSKMSKIIADFSFVSYFLP